MCASVLRSEDESDAAYRVTPREDERGSAGRRASGSASRSRRRSESAGGSEQSSSLFRIARMLYGGVLAFMALDNLRNMEERIGYAEAKGAPSPDRSVPAISLSLLLGSIGIALWRVPAAAAAAVAGFFASVTPVMHDFWTMDDEEQAQQQQLHFLKNSALLGAALGFLHVARKRD